MVIQTRPEVPVNRFSLNERDDVFYRSTRQRCCCCGKKLGDGPAIQQLQASRFIYLHAGCAAKFVTRLLRDIHDVEAITKQPITREGRI